jgi:hypothetical protein
VISHEYQFRTAWAQRMYLGLSAMGGKVGFNAAAPALPLVAAADRRARGDGGAIVLVRARRAAARSQSRAAARSQSRAAARSQSRTGGPAAGVGGSARR